MESLLSLAFDSIASKEPTKIRKGLRHIEGLLAQICLSETSNIGSPSKRRNSSRQTSQQQQQVLGAKQLRELNSDAAFREFWRLQESFEWNVTSRLLPTLNQLLSLRSSTTNDALILHALSLLQGLLLLHPPSRSLFSTPTAMNLLLDLLDPPSTQSAALLTLVAALIACPRNTRAFEKADGLVTVTSLFKNKSTAQEVKLKVLEFLYFYLMPESAEDVDVVGGNGSGRSGKSAGSGGGSEKSTKSAGGESETRTMREKQKLLGRYLTNVEDLVQDLRESAPFGDVPC